MGKQTSSGGDVADAFKVLLARVGEIFGVFDLSFFVAGAVCLGAVLFGGQVFGLPWPGPIRLQDWGAVHVAAAVVASYVLGMVCFSAGRTVGRRLWRRRGLDHLARQIHKLGLAAHYRSLLPPADATEKDAEARYALLYTRLWAELRQDEELAPSFNLITRYWILAAMCDGLAAAFGLWGVVWGFYAARAGADGAHPSSQGLVLVGLGLLAAALLSSYEASRYGEYQVVEVLATLAHRHVPLSPAPESPEPNASAPRPTGSGASS